jgi:hypothetical protein
VFGKPEFKELDSLITVGHQPVAPAGETPESPFVVALNAARAENLPGNGTAIEGLGHSFAAVQMRQGSALAFTFDIPAPGDYWIKIATLPNHDADGNGMKIALSVDGKHIQDFDYRVTGRDETWKENVLRGQALSVARHHFREAGKVSLSIRALTSYIILDQVMIGNGNDDFYEFPVNRE